MLIQKAVNESLHLHPMYVKGAYLNAPTDKEIYVQQPPGYELTHESGAHFTCRLQKVSSWPKTEWAKLAYHTY
jgi:Reverse transcriptase (RNA-dependent DNA polymerase)